MHVAFLGTPRPARGRTRVDTLFHHAAAAGWTIYPLWFLGLVLGLLVLDRGAALLTARGPMQQLTDALRPMLEAGDLDAALSTAAMTSGASARVALRVLRQGLSQPGHQGSAVAAALEEETQRVERRLGALQSIAGLAFLLGMLGCITSFVVPWPSVPSFIASSRATMLANAIAEALGVTWLGLLLAVLSVVAVSTITGATRWFQRALHREAQVLVGMLWTHRARLRLQVGKTVLRASGCGPATYRDAA